MNKKVSKKVPKLIEHFPECLNVIDMKVIMIGNQELLVENYCGIGEYLETKIVIRGRKNRLIIEGEHLLISYYSKYDLKICGTFTSLRWNK